MSAVMEALVERVGWEETPKQGEFLSAHEYEVLYGGAAGGGKTDAMLVDALGITPEGAHCQKPAYRAIIFRRTYPDLKDIIDRSAEIYKDFDKDATFDKQAHRWTFKGGGKIEFGYIARDAERFRYRGRAFQYIGWEELSLWPTQVPYQYLMSRNRTVDKTIPLYVRSTTNPDGPGFKWVKSWFSIQTSGQATRSVIKLTDPDTGETFETARRFIPARLADNPHLDNDYRINLLLLEKDDQDRLLRGLWQTPQIRGAYYTKEIEAARKERRIVTKIPYIKNVPVDTFWDLGLSKDSGTTALWCGQFVAMQMRFLCCYENHSQSLDHYTKWMQDTGYSFGRHFLPHDAYVRRLGKDNIKSWKRMLEELLPGHEFVKVRRTPHVGVAISETKARFGEACFDETGCAEGIAALENYQRGWDEDNQAYTDHPLHNWASNYADAFRQWAQGWETSRTGIIRARPEDAWRPNDPTMGY